MDSLFSHFVKWDFVVSNFWMLWGALSLNFVFLVFAYIKKVGKSLV